MKLNLKKIPREYNVGRDDKITIKDCGQIHLDPDEQVTFMTADDREYDLCRKDWGYYATPSMNDRLKRFGFKTALVRNSKGQIFIMLVESDKLGLFKQYLSDEDNTVLNWLDESTSSRICICGSLNLARAHEYHTRPEGEINLNIKEYNRILYQCEECGHYISQHSYDLDNLYSEQYVTYTYGTSLKETFDKIIAFNPEKSDNYWRVKRIKGFFGEPEGQISSLDVGSGLCVFPYMLQKETGWKCMALDPDQRQADHAESVGITAYHSDFMNANISEKFDLITFNKVLEHVSDPVVFLSKAHEYLKDDATVYVELPDGEEAFKDCPLREELFIDHLCAFSATSMAILARKSGFIPLKIERIIEKSGKYTLYMFCKKGDLK